MARGIAAYRRAVRSHVCAANTYAQLIREGCKDDATLYYTAQMARGRAREVGDTEAEQAWLEVENEHARRAGF